MSFGEPISLRDTKDDDPHARIKVIGVGGGGGNALNRMIEAGIEGVEFLVANADLQALRRSRAPIKIHLGGILTRGLGVGANPDIGRKAVLEDLEEVIDALKDADMVFIVAGLGGGMGTGGAPIIASLAREMSALTVAVVTMPFHFEGKRRMAQAEQGLRELRENVDAVINIPLERLLPAADPKMSLQDAFKMADDILSQAVQGISNLITVPGLVNLDFADVRALISGMGLASIGSGRASGENRAVEATQQALSGPLLLEGTLEGARGVLINIMGGSDLTLYEVNESSSIIREAVADDANIIFGAMIDESLSGEIVVTIIFTGFDLPSDSTGIDQQLNKAEPQIQDKYLGDVIIVWDPDVVEPADYVSLVTALGDLVRIEGGIGVERIREQGFGIPVGEEILV
jgi:cell division protein FtsZ